MTIWEHLRVAREFFPELSRSYVLDCRRIYQIGVFIEQAREDLKKRKQRARLATLPSQGRVTDEMIERAREFSVCDLILEFPKGRAKAWCHDDRNPSLYYGSKKGVAVCPVCNKSFDAIGILMERDGFSFSEAVRQLQ